MHINRNIIPNNLKIVFMQQGIYIGLNIKMLSHDDVACCGLFVNASITNNNSDK